MTNGSSSADAQSEPAPKEPYATHLAFIEQAMRAGPLARIHEVEGIRGAVVALGQRVAEASSAERVRALAALAALTKAEKSVKHVAGVQLKVVLAEAPGLLDTLSSDKEQLAVCQVVAKHRGTWVDSYFAGNAARPALGAKVRAAAMKELFGRAPSWRHAFDLVSAARRDAPGATSGPSAVPEFVAVLGAARIALARAKNPPGDGLGEGVFALAEAFVSEWATALSEKDRAKVVAETLSFLAAATAKRPILLDDASLYSTLSKLRTASPKGKWSSAASELVTGIATRLSDLVSMEARRGRMAEELAMYLAAAAGGRDAALKLMRAIARETPGVSPMVSAWLEGKATMEMERALGDSDDEQIARLLLRAEEVRAKGDVSPASGAGSDALVAAVIAEVDNVAACRRLRVVGTVGAEAEYAPALHRLSGDLGEGGTRVRVLVPGVARMTEDGRSETVVPAIVEPAEGA